MFGHFHPAGIQHLAVQAFAALGLLAPAAVGIDRLRDVHDLVRVDRHNLFTIPSNLLTESRRPSDIGPGAAFGPWSVHPAGE